MKQSMELESARQEVSMFWGRRKKLLEILVNQNSESENVAGVNRVQSMLEDAFWELGLRTERVPCAGRGDILLAKNGVGPREPWLLVGHADTVHSPKSDFQKLTERNGTLIGPGVLDMKGGLIQILLALDFLKAKGLLATVPLRILVNSAEEKSTAETKEKVLSLARGARAALVCEIGRLSNGIVLERKGIIELQVTAQGREAHSGNSFYEGINALVPLCRLGAFASELSNKERDLTVNVASLSGGGHLCVVPGSGALGLEIRACSSEALDNTLAQLRSYCAGEAVTLTIHLQNRIEPLNAHPEAEALLRAYQQAGETVGLTLTALPRVGGVSDANVLGQLGIPILDALGPIGEGAHTKSEYVVEESIVARAAALGVFLALN